MASYAVECIVGAIMSFEARGSLVFVSAMKLVVSVSFLLNRGRAAARLSEAPGSENENYGLVTPVSKAPLSMEELSAGEELVFGVAGIGSDLFGGRR
jgi:hypothetical protein